MLSFLYSLFLKLLYPTSLSLLLLLLSALLRKWAKLSRLCFWLAMAVLLVCGNGWLLEGLTRHLERQYPPLQDHGTTGQRDDRSMGPRDMGITNNQSSTLNSQQSQADAILILSGGILGQLPPRPTVEIGEAGDRLLYGAHLYRQGKATRIICTGNVATGGIAPRPAADDMAEFLEFLNVPPDAIIRETKSGNTREHARNLKPVFENYHFRRVLLVTSAMHMPRSMGVFRKHCPEVEFIPAPTDFRATEKLPVAWYREVVYLIPTPRGLADFSEVTHEYLGIAYYRLRGWL